jgi:hypothetical protein
VPAWQGTQDSLARSCVTGGIVAAAGPFPGQRPGPEATDLGSSVRLNPRAFSFSGGAQPAVG